MRTAVIFCLLTLATTLCGQEKERVLPVGFLYRHGIRSGNSLYGTSVGSHVVSYNNNLFGFGVYRLQPLFKNDSLKRIFRFVRIEVGGSRRGGPFEAASGTIAKITSTTIDLNLFVPAVFDMGRSIRGYVGIGLGAAYVYDRNFLPMSAGSEFQDDSELAFGLNLEFGFMIGSASFIAVRPIDDLIGNFEYSGSSLVIGFSPQGLVGKRKR